MKNNMLNYSLSTLILLGVICTNSYGQFEQKFTLQFSSGIARPLGLTNYFKMGVPLNAGVQYNHSRSFAIVGLLNWVKLTPKADYINTTWNTLNISLCPKYRFLAEKKISPYILGGLGFGYLSYELLGEKEKSPAYLQFFLGGGVDATISDNIALFVQTLSGGNLYLQIGINISFLKSKSL